MVILCVQAESKKKEYVVRRDECWTKAGSGTDWTPRAWSRPDATTTTNNGYTAPWIICLQLGPQPKQAMQKGQMPKAFPTRTQPGRLRENSYHFYARNSG